MEQAFFSRFSQFQQQSVYVDVCMRSFFSCSLLLSWWWWTNGEKIYFKAECVLLRICSLQSQPSSHTHTHASSTQSIHSLWQTIISLLFCQVVMWSRVDRDLMVIMINKNCSLCIIIKVDCRSIISCIVLYRLLRSLERTHNWKQFSQKLIVCRFGTRVCALLNCFELSFFITWSYG